MYMQTEHPILPKNYSGNAFSPNGERLFPAPAQQEPPDDALQEATMPTAAQSGISDEAPEQTAEAFAQKSAETRPVSGLISRFPFLSSLLPPRRAGRNDALLPDWVLLGAVALLFLADGDNDILPLLLLLLLWE